METPLCEPYRADVQRYCHQVHQLADVPRNAPQLRALLCQAHDTVARWCLLPDVLPEAAEQLRRSERELYRLKHEATARVGVQQQLAAVLQRVCSL